MMSKNKKNHILNGALGAISGSIVGVASVLNIGMLPVITLGAVSAFFMARILKNSGGEPKMATLLISALVALVPVSLVKDAISSAQTETAKVVAPVEQKTKPALPESKTLMLKFEGACTGAKLETAKDGGAELVLPRGCREEKSSRERNTGRSRDRNSLDYADSHV